MTIILTLASSATMMMTMKASNPVKSSISILFVSVLLFSMMGLFTSSTWIPILMLMLFMGGIIMMFMILSSVLPNEKSGKVKNPLTFLVLIIFSAMMAGNSSKDLLVACEMKSFLSSGQNFMLMMTIILIYFAGCMSMLSSENTPMRTMTCY